MTMSNYRRIHRLLAMPLSVFVLMLTLSGPLAYAQEETTALEGDQPSDASSLLQPSNTAGEESSTGPTQPTGPTVQTGPTGPNGAPCQTGVTYSGGYCQGYSQGKQQGADQGLLQGSSQGVGQNAPTTAAELNNASTGANSANNNTVSQSSSANSAATNAASATNDVDMNLSTGSNTLQANTSVGNVSTGDIEGSLTIVNALNSVFAPGSSVGLGSFSTDEQGNLLLTSGAARALLPTNVTTGAGSTNTNAYSGMDAVTIRTDNSALVDNDIDIVADTGNNLLDANTTLGDVTTGSIDLAVNLINLLNVLMPDTLFTLDVWSWFGDLIGDMALGNSHTGSDSTNTNEIDHVGSATVTATNDADIANDFAVATTTGDNTFTGNSVVGDVSTGNVRVDGSVTNIANAGAPMFYIVNVLGDWAGGSLGLPAGSFIVNELGNMMTGSGSTNANTVAADAMLDVSRTANATADNRIGIAANTGGNTFSRNTELGNVRTGDVNILANVLNFLNTTSNALSSFSLGIINIFGDWKAPVASPGIVRTLAGSEAGQAPLPDPSSSNDGLEVTKDTSFLKPSTYTLSYGADVPTASKSQSQDAEPILSVGAVAGTNAGASDRSAQAQVLNTQGAPTVLAATAERHMPSIASASEQAGINWQLILVLLIVGGFFVSWAAVEYLALRAARR